MVVGEVRELPDAIRKRERRGEVGGLHAARKAGVRVSPRGTVREGELDLLGGERWAALGPRSEAMGRGIHAPMLPRI